MWQEEVTTRITFEWFTNQSAELGGIILIFINIIFFIVRVPLSAVHILVLQSPSRALR